MGPGIKECMYVDVQMRRIITRRRDWKLKIAVCFEKVCESVTSLYSRSTEEILFRICDCLLLLRKIEETAWRKSSDARIQ